MIIIKALGYLVQFIEIMVFIRVLMSWIPAIGNNRGFVEFIYAVTDPIIEPVKNIMDRYINTGPIDFSPIVALFLLQLVYDFLTRALIRFMFF